MKIKTLRIFPVPEKALDYLKIASGVQAKILLYICGNPGGFTAGEAARLAGIPESEAHSAIDFWLNDTAVFDDGKFDAHDRNEVLPSNPDSPELPAFKAVSAKPPRKLYTPAECADWLKTSEEGRFAYATYEQLKRETLSHAEINALVTAINEVGLPAECFVMLMEYLAQNDALRPKKLISMAEEWAEYGIVTVAKAADQISWLSRNGYVKRELAKLMNTQHISDKQVEQATVWNNAGMSFATIGIAYQKALDMQTAKPFPYAAKIVGKWLESGIRTPEQAKSDLSGNKPASAKKESSLNMSEIKELF